MTRSPSPSPRQAQPLREADAPVAPGAQGRRDEAGRLAALQGYGILDTPAEDDFDELTRLAAQICRTPIALITLVDRDRDWFKARVGLEVAEIRRELSFSSEAILTPGEIFLVRDASKDPRFSGNELVASGIRFCAGVPLVTHRGHALGTISVMDRAPRDLPPEEAEALRVLSHQVMTRLEMRRHLAELEHTLARLDQAEVLLRQTLGFRAAAEPTSAAPPTLTAPLVPLALLAAGLLLWNVRSPTSPPWATTLALLSGAMVALVLSAAVAWARIAADRRARPLAEEMTRALRESEAGVRAVVDNVADGILTFDAEGVLGSYNAAAERIFGYTPSEVLSRGIEVLFPSGRRDLRDGFRSESEGRKKDGTLFPVDLAISEMRVGKVRSFIAIVRDISERRRAMLEQAVQYAVTRSLSESVALEDALPRILEAVTHALGWDFAICWICHRDEQVLRPAAFWRRPGEFEELEARNRGLTLPVGDGLSGLAWQQGSPLSFRDVQAAEGVTRLASVAAAGLHGAYTVPVAVGSELLGVLEFFSRSVAEPDPTLLDLFRAVGSQVALFLERDAADKALRASDEQTRAVMENMLEGLIIVDERGIIESVNPAAQQIFGYGAWELVGQHLKTLMPLSAGERAGAFLKSARAKALGKITEWEGRRKSGELFRFDLSLFEFLTPDGLHLAGHVRDVSDRRKLERMKQEFVATVSHELRTPLTSIRGSLSLLAGNVLGEMSDEAHEVVAIAERNAVRLISLINDILDMERSESGKMEMKIQAVTVRTIVESCLESVRAFSEQKGVALETEIPEATIYADGDRIVQVLVNLVSNAVKFSPRGSSVRVSAEAAGQDSMEFRVADHGRGIPKEDQEAVFERFKQVEASDARQKGGTGLGLAICKAIVEQHGGTIGVTSAWGSGSTFYFRIPCNTPDKAQGGDQFLEAMRMSSRDGESGDVLLVDDDDALLGVLIRQLLQDGIAVRTARTGAEAIRLASARAPALLIMDVGLPDLDGFAVVEALRNDARLKALPIVVYTGRDLSSEQRDRLTLGPTRFVTKSRASDADFRTLVLSFLKVAGGPAKP